MPRWAETCFPIFLYTNHFTDYYRFIAHKSESCIVIVIHYLTVFSGIATIESHIDKL